MQKYILLLWMGLSVAMGYGQALNFSCKMNTKLKIETSGGTAGSVYEWRLDNVLLAETGASLTYRFERVGTFQLSVRERQGECAGEALTGQIVVEPLEQDFSGTLEVGATALLEAQCSDEKSTFVWIVDGQVQTETSSALKISFANIGQHDVSVQETTSGGCIGQKTYGVIDVTETTKVLEPSVPAPQNVCPGSAATFSCTATSNKTISYQWQQSSDQGLTWTAMDNSSRVEGAQTSTLMLKTALGMDGQKYRCVLSNSSSTATSEAALLSLKKATEISQMPLAGSKVVGDAVELSVLAQGEGELVYQWLKDGQAIAQANASRLTIGSLQKSDAGLYQVRVSGACGVVTSSEAKLSVHQQASIEKGSQETSSCAGKSIVYRVEASGEEPLVYRWEENRSGAWMAIEESARFAGTSTNSLSVNVDEGMAGFLCRCVVTNAYGQASYAMSALQLNKATSISQQPKDVAKAIGSSLSFQVMAEGEGELSYQWSKDGFDIPGANRADYTIASLSLADVGKYRLSVSGACGKVLSQEASLQIGAAPRFIDQPQDAQACPGTEQEFRVSTQSDLPVDYQWQMSSQGSWSNLADNESFSGTSSQNLKVLKPVEGTEWSFRCLAHSGYGTTESSVVVLKLKKRPSFSSLANASVCPNSPAQYTSTVEGISPMRLQWQVQQSSNWADLAEGGSYSGTQSSSLSVQAAQGMDGWSYRLVAQNECGEGTSGSARLNLKEETRIAEQPSSALKRVGEKAELSITAKGSSLRYQWKKGAAALADGGRVSGATSPSLVIDDLRVEDAGQYSCELSGDCGKMESSSAQLSVGTAPSVVAMPQDAVVCAGSEAVFQLQASGSETISYQWQQQNAADWTDLEEGTSISGAKTAVLRISTSEQMDGQQYRCVIKNPYGAANSGTATLVVKQRLALSQKPEDATKRLGETVSFEVVASGSDLEFQWYKGSILSPKDQIVQGENRSRLTLDNLKATDAAFYAVVVKGYCETQLVGAALKIPALPVISEQSQPAEVCDGAWASFSVSASETESVTYNWQESHDQGSIWSAMVDGKDYSGCQSKLLTVRGTLDRNHYQYRCELSSFAGSLISNAAELRVKAQASISQQPTEQERSLGESAHFSIQTSGTVQRYQWFRDAQALSNSDKYEGTTSAELTIKALGFDDRAAYSCQITSECSQEMSQAAYLKIKKLPQSIRFDAIAEHTFTDADFDLNASASSALAVSFRCDDPTVAVVVGSKLHLLRAGTVHIIASQAGDDHYEAAPEVSQPLNISPVLPQIQTYYVRDLNAYSALVESKVLANGGSDLLERGVCWCKHENPSLKDMKMNMGTGIGSYESMLKELEPNTVYYVCAFARNSAGTAYGNQIRFATTPAPISEQAHHIQFSRVDLSSFDVSWMRGNGEQCIVFIKECESGNALPLDRESYSPDAIYGRGGQIGSTGWFCAYKGTGNTVSVTGLVAGKTYTVMVCEMNGSEGNWQYLTSIATGNPSSKTTSPMEPLVYTFFSPNDDGRNDLWIIENADLLARSEVRVFTKSNQEVYRSQGYAVPWDGKRDGQTLPVGEYYYSITGEYQLKGILVLMHQ